MHTSKGNAKRISVRESCMQFNKGNVSCMQFNKGNLAYRVYGEKGEKMFLTNKETENYSVVMKTRHNTFHVMSKENFENACDAADVLKKRNPICHYAVVNEDGEVFYEV